MSLGAHHRRGRSRPTGVRDLALDEMQVDITLAGADRLSPLASLFGRTLVEEPMVRWPLGVHGDIEERFTRLFAWFSRA
jgi:hypothetical protein